MKRPQLVSAGSMARLLQNAGDAWNQHDYQQCIEMLERSARNLREVRVLLAANLNIRDLLTGDTVVLTKDAVEHLTEVLS